VSHVQVTIPLPVSRILHLLAAVLFCGVALPQTETPPAPRKTFSLPSLVEGHVIGGLFSPNEQCAKDYVKAESIGGVEGRKLQLDLQAEKLRVVSRDEIKATIDAIKKHQGVHDPKDPRRAKARSGEGPREPRGQRADRYGF
jgi:hypothetical protein